MPFCNLFMGRPS